MTSNSLALLNQLRPMSVGFNDIFERFEAMLGSNPTLNRGFTANYPPYNIIQVGEGEYLVQVALAGFKKEEVKVFTEYGKLFVQGKKEDEKKEENEYLHRGMAQRSFQRQWQLSDDSTIKNVTFEDGMLIITLGKIVPEHHARKEFL